MRTTNRTAAIAAAIVVMAAGASVAVASPFRARGAGELRDLQPATAQPFDHATAQVVAVEDGDGTTVTLKVQGVDHDAAGTTFGAHVHIGPCEAGNGGAALGHYNHDGGFATPLNEVWLDVAIGSNGTGSTTAEVPFTIDVGDAYSVVIHAIPTAPGGGAGARWACLPVEF
jgi:Cu/Zn superoxide dismutase